jgi:hypothetical protein
MAHGEDSMIPRLTYSLLHQAYEYTRGFAFARLSISACLVLILFCLLLLFCQSRRTTSLDIRRVHEGNSRLSRQEDQQVALKYEASHKANKVQLIATSNTAGWLCTYYIYKKNQGKGVSCRTRMSVEQ